MSICILFNRCNACHFMYVISLVVSRKWNRMQMLMTWLTVCIKRCPICVGHFLQKGPIISGSFVDEMKWDANTHGINNSRWRCWWNKLQILTKPNEMQMLTKCETVDSMRYKYSYGMGCPMCVGHFLQKSPIVSGSFVDERKRKCSRNEIQSIN